MLAPNRSRCAGSRKGTFTKTPQLTHDASAPLAVTSSSASYLSVYEATCRRPPMHHKHRPMTGLWAPKHELPLIRWSSGKNVDALDIDAGPNIPFFWSIYPIDQRFSDDWIARSFKIGPTSYHFLPIYHVLFTRALRTGVNDHLNVVPDRCKTTPPAFPRAIALVDNPTKNRVHDFRFFTSKDVKESHGFLPSG